MLAEAHRQAGLAAGWDGRPGAALPAHLHALLGWRLTGLGLNSGYRERHSPLVMDQLRSRCALCEHKRRDWKTR